MKTRKLAAIALALLLSVVVAGSAPATAATNAGPRTNAPCSTFVEVADFSMWQGDIDWRAYASQRPAAFIKATEGVSYKDPKFDRNAWYSAGAGVATGAYHFAQPSRGDAIREADWFVSVARPVIGPGHLPPTLDLESNPYGMSGPELDQWALDFLGRVWSTTGAKPIIYTGAYFAGVGTNPALATYGLWIAAYLAGYQPNPNPCTIGSPAVPNVWGGKGWDVWQFTSSNDTAGVRGRVDMSVVPPNVYAEWLGTGTVDPQPPTSTGDPQPAEPANIAYRIGSRGPKVAQIQAIVGVPSDGVYGPVTAAAVARWQNALGVGADGVWGQQTDDATKRFFDALAGLGRSGRPRVGYGTRSQDVCDAQALLIDNGYEIDLDCIFGPAFNHQLIDWQDRNGIPHGLPLSVIDGPTWESLGQVAA